MRLDCAASLLIVLAACACQPDATPTPELPTVTAVSLSPPTKAITLEASQSTPGLAETQPSPSRTPARRLTATSPPAAKHCIGVRVINGYDDMWRHCCSTFDGENLRYLTPGGHNAERRFNRDFIRALIEMGAPMEIIFAYDLTNEVHFSLDKPPFSLASGTVTTANRKSYDMSNAEDKQRMMDENLVYWIDQQRANILEVDPTALVTVSFPANNSGQTTVNPRPAILESTADLVDLHAYAGWGLSLELYMRRFGIEGPPDKPTILGEYGASRRAFPSIEIAAGSLAAHQISV